MYFFFVATTLNVALINKHSSTAHQTALHRSPQRFFPPIRSDSQSPIDTMNKCLPHLLQRALSQSRPYIRPRDATKISEASMTHAVLSLDFNGHATCTFQSKHLSLKMKNKCWDTSGIRLWCPALKKNLASLRRIANGNVLTAHLRPWFWLHLQSWQELASKLRKRNHSVWQYPDRRSLPSRQGC